MNTQHNVLLLLVYGFLLEFVILEALLSKFTMRYCDLLIASWYVYYSYGQPSLLTK